MTIKSVCVANNIALLEADKTRFWVKEDGGVKES